MSLDPVELCIELVNTPSESRNEANVADLIESTLSRFSHLRLKRVGNNLIVNRNDTGQSKFILAGHIDTVPPSVGYLPYRDGNRIYGVGSTDMKGGVAVMMALASDPDLLAPVTYIFYVCEEIDRRFSGLLEIERDSPDVLRAEAAILMEPTLNVIEAGCQGTLRMRLHVGGRKAHTARPHIGENAIHRSAEFLLRIASVHRRSVIIDGCDYKEATSVVKIVGGVANNVVPDEVDILINHRFAPDRSIEEATDFVSGLFSQLLREDLGDYVSLEEAAPSARPNLENPFLAKLAESVGTRRGKLGWTDVAFFSERGVPATNFGPGDPEMAHTAGEWVDVDQIVAAKAILTSVLS